MSVRSLVSCVHEVKGKNLSSVKLVVHSGSQHNEPCVLIQSKSVVFLFQECKVNCTRLFLEKGL